MPSYRECRAPSYLSEWVECAWSLHLPDAVSHRVSPDGCIDLVYDSENGLRIVGAMTTAEFFAFSSNTTVVGIRFHPGMAGSFLQFPLAELTDGSLDLTGSMVEQLRNAESPDEAHKILLAMLPAPSKPLTPVQRAIRAIMQARGNLDLDYCADQANLSSRQFRRRCEEASGLTPKLLARVLRFRYVCHLARLANRQPNWATLALDAGYFDQAHLIRDFREFMKVPPTSIFCKTVPMPPLCLGPETRPGSHRAPWFCPNSSERRHRY